MPVAPFGKHGGRIKLAKYTAGIPRRLSEALIKHPSEALLVFPLSSSVSLTPHHPLTQAFPILSRGSTGGSAPLPHVKPGSVARKKKFIQFSNSPRPPPLPLRCPPGNAAVLVCVCEWTLSRICLRSEVDVYCLAPANENCNPGRAWLDFCVA